tara:strand:- start:642 stop:1187 length:546 start_codon:yes stop_codon:yes gene_type:complete
MTILKLLRVISRIAKYKFSTPEFLELIVESRRIYNYPKGQVGVQGSYDGNGLVTITLISDYDDSQVFDFSEKSARRWFLRELEKVIAHEEIHIEQEQRGDFAPCSSANDFIYFANDSEIEAYGRADVRLEVLENYSGLSQTVRNYMDLFGEDSYEVNELLRFYKSETGWKYPYEHGYQGYI